MGKPVDLVQGTLDLLILKSIGPAPRHGWAIAQRITQLSEDGPIVVASLAERGDHRRVRVVVAAACGGRPLRTDRVRRVQRTREFGVRMAVGAAPSQISRLVLRRGALLAVTGALLGLGGAVGLVRSMESLLYGVPTIDPVGFGAAAALLPGVALAASYLPARQAARTNPTSALWAE